MTTLQVRITVSPIPAGFAFSGRGFIDSLDSLLKKTCGGLCVGAVADGQMTLEARATSRDDVASLVESYCRHFRGEQRQVQVVIVENPKIPLSGSEVVAGASLNAAPAKLTRAFFMKQAEGVFLASNVLKQGFEPVFAESVGGADTRAAQWTRIKAVGADQRASHAFPSEGHYRHWHQQQVEYFSSLQR